MRQRAGWLRERYLADQKRTVQAYASATSAAPGESLEFRVSVPGGGSCSVTVRRFGTAVPTRAVRFQGEGQGGGALAWVSPDRCGGVGFVGEPRSDEPTYLAGGQELLSGPFTADGLREDSAIGHGHRDPASDPEASGGGPASVAHPIGSGSAVNLPGARTADFDTGHHPDGAFEARGDRIGGLLSDPDPTALPLTWCDWAPSLLLDIPESWPPGLYVARFTVAVAALARPTALGRTAYVPFVVRARQVTTHRTLVVLPFATYTARNRWPVDGVTGRSLEAGYTSHGRSSVAHRAPAVSFDRPFAGNGLPERFAEDATFVQRLASGGTVADYATSVDLHSGLVDPGGYDTVLLTAHEDYWSPEMCAAVRQAVDNGTEVRWPVKREIPSATVRFGPSPDGRPDRVLAALAAPAGHT